MGKIKNSTPYITIIVLLNSFIGIMLIAKPKYLISTIDVFIYLLLLITITIFEILLTNVLINIQNNLIIQTKLYEKSHNNSEEKSVDIIRQ